MRQWWIDVAKLWFMFETIACFQYGNSLELHGKIDTDCSNNCRPHILLLSIVDGNWHRRFWYSARNTKWNRRENTSAFSHQFEHNLLFGQSVCPSFCRNYILNLWNRFVFHSMHLKISVEGWMFPLMIYDFRVKRRLCSWFLFLLLFFLFLVVSSSVCNESCVCMWVCQHHHTTTHQFIFSIFYFFANDGICSIHFNYSIRWNRNYILISVTFSSE